ncbi:STAS domain-containing protein [Desulfogranum japonicum]|uniref:STAS domain-containing protein n=1 Tax=Desulfogranum japonicum TaxID=231447 RepID=UPI0003F8A6E9|nr:STAS domain-containing protein [Desulfogranum japonicum]
MKQYSSVSALGSYTISDCLIVPVAPEAEVEELQRLHREILELVAETGAKGVLVNLSSVNILSSYSFTTLREILRGVSLLGATGVLVGLRPGVVAAWVDRDLDFSEMHTARTMEDALALVTTRREKQEADAKQA